MSIFVVMWLSWACPGGPLTSWLGPVFQRLRCEPQVRMMAYPDEDQAEATARKLGCDAVPALCEIRPNGRIKCREIKCSEVMSIDD